MNEAASLPVADLLPRCHVCGREIRDGQWFGRFPANGALAYFCRPACAERWFDARHPVLGNETAVDVLFAPQDPTVSYA